MKRWFPEIVALIAVLVMAGVSSCGSSGPQASGCDLVHQTGCASGQKCTFACGSNGAVIACVADGTLAVGAACPNADMCVAGSFCASRSSDPMPSCRKLCDTGADCPSGTCTQVMLGFCGTTTMTGFCD